MFEYFINFNKNPEKLEVETSLKPPNLGSELLNWQNGREPIQLLMEPNPEIRDFLTS